MGILAGVGKFLGIVDANDTASNLAKDLSSGIDKLFYTDEEKAEASTKMYDQWLAMVQVMKSSEVYRSITRRILAVGIVFFIIGLVSICVASEILHSFSWVIFDQAVFDVVESNGLEFTNVTWSIIKIADVFQLGWVFCTIIVFYFGPHLIQLLSGKK